MSETVPKLSPKEAQRLFRSRTGVVRLATADASGKPHVVPVWFVYRNRRFYIPCPSTTRKIRHITRRKRVALVLDSYRGVLDCKGVLVHGKAKIIKGPASRKWNMLIHLKYLGAKRMKQEKWLRFMEADDITLVVEPTWQTSWDFAKLKMSS